jgi:copper transport protein
VISEMAWRRFLRVLVIALCAVGFVGARPAIAEPTLIDGTAPAPDSVVPESPTEILLVFSEPLTQAPRLTLIEQTTGLPVAAIGTAAQGDSADQWIVPLTAPLNPGVYKATWIAAPSSSSFVFTVGGVAVTPGAGATTPGAAIPVDPANPTAADPATPTTVAGTPATGGTGSTAGEPRTTGGLPGVLGRWISSLGIAALAGALMLIAFTWPEGVEYALTITYLRVVWVVAMIGTVMVVVSERAAAQGTTFAGSLSPSGWFDLTDTKPGVALLARLFFVAASAWVAFVPERAIDAATQIPAFAAPMLALFTFGFARVIEPGLGALMIPASIVHAVSVAAWFGGLALLARVVLAGPGDEDLVHAVRGFSRLAAPALIGVFFSGLFMIARNVGGVGNLFSTGYGRLVVLKVVVFVFMLRLALENRATVAKRLSPNGGLGPKAAERLRRSVGAEALAGVVVLGLTGSLFSQTPEGIETIVKQKSNKVEKPVVIPRLDGPGVDVKVGVGPAEVGLNDLTVTVVKPSSGLVEMTLTIDGPTGDPFQIEVYVAPPLSGEGELTILDVPFCTAGTWRISLAGQNADGALAASAAALEIKNTEAPKPAVCTASTAGTPALPAPPGGVVVPVDPATTPTDTAAPATG